MYLSSVLCCLLSADWNLSFDSIFFIMMIGMIGWASAAVSYFQDDTMTLQKNEILQVKSNHTREVSISSIMEHVTIFWFMYQLNLWMFSNVLSDMFDFVKEEKKYEIYIFYLVWTLNFILLCAKILLIFHNFTKTEILTLFLVQQFV